MKTIENKSRYTWKSTLLLRLVFLAMSLCIVIWVVDFNVVFTFVRKIPLTVFISLVFLGLLRILLSVIRWIWLNPDQSKQISFWHYFRLTMISKPFNLILPGALGGDFARTALTLKSLQSNRGDNLIAIIVDRCVGLFSITIFGFIALFFISDIPDKVPLYTFFIVLVCGFIAGITVVSNKLLLLFFERIFRKVGKLGCYLLQALQVWRHALVFFRRNRWRVLAALGICIPIHGVSFYSAYILAVQLDMPISFYDMSAVLALVWIITAVPVTVSGTGVRELSLIYLLSFYGIDSESATALSLSIYMITVLLGLIGLVFFIFDKDI